MNGFYCFNCGRFWWTEEKLECHKNHCPFCHDLWFGDNVIPNQPSDLFQKEKVLFDCGHSLETDTPGDLKICTFCNGKPINPSKEKSLENWQLNRLEELQIP